MISFSGKKSVIKGKTKALKKSISSIVFDHGYSILQIDYIFVDDDTLLEMNKSVLKHDYYTDIITFDYTVGKVLEGEIYISVDRVKENSKVFEVSFHVELSRVIFHGVLHMVGYKDKSKQQKLDMRKMEDHYIEQIES